MKDHLMLEEKHRILKKTLHENLDRKLLVETDINRQWEELKKLEILLEKLRVNNVENSNAILYTREME